jgi:hypothetical protein
MPQISGNHLNLGGGPVSVPAVTVDLDCPRCGTSLLMSGQDFYGPCASCVTDLKAKFLRVGRSVETSEYEPKMNVTPNAVATKD